MAANCCNDSKESETSSVTAKNGCSEVGGYDCDFVEPPADDLLCKICHYPAREPILTICCGHNLCSYCLEHYHQSKAIIDHDPVCPCCHKGTFQSMPDKRTERYVLDLKVFCPHKHQGCNWTGELRSVKNHLKEDSKNCLFTKCSNGCGEVMQRRLVEGHLKSECRLREVNCKYCNTTGSYQWISSSHQEECPKYPVECPNHCEAGHVRREEISGHLEECPQAIVECPYAAVGCESVVRRKEKMDHITISIGEHMEYNKNAILDMHNELERIKKDLQDANDRLDAKEKMLQATKLDLYTTKNRVDARERDMENIKRYLQATRDRLGAKEQEITNMKKDLQDTNDKLKESQKIQSELKTAITEKGRELDEVRKNTAKNNRISQVMIQQMKDKLEGTERSLEDQLKINTQLQLQIETIFNSNWSLRLSYLVNGSNGIVPVVTKLTEFDKRKDDKYSYSTGFYTAEEGYKMCLIVFPKGRSCGTEDHVAVGVCLMKGDHDFHLTWPVTGTLTIQLLNQLSDNNHSEPFAYHFDGSSKNCQRVEIISHHGVWINEFMPHKRLSYDADKKCQYLKDNCVFFRVCNFQ